jgi:hypothetical protein
MKWLLTTAQCNLFQSQNNLMSWYASKFLSIFLYICHLIWNITFLFKQTLDYFFLFCTILNYKMFVYCWVLELQSIGSNAKIIKLLNSYYYRIAWSC